MSYLYALIARNSVAGRSTVLGPRAEVGGFFSCLVASVFTSPPFRAAALVAAAKVYLMESLKCCVGTT